MEVEIRPAQPTDGEEIAPFIHSSGPAAFDYILSHNTPLDAIGFIRRVFPTGKGECGYPHHIAAELDGHVVGSAAGWTAEQLRGFTLRGVGQVLSIYGLWTGAKILSRSHEVEGCLSAPGKGEFYVGHVGVAPMLRGKGIGRRIMEHMIALGRARGCSAVVLDVSVENPRAQALYERLGFSVVKEIPSDLENSTARVPSHRKMVKPLHGA